MRASTISAAYPGLYLIALLYFITACKEDKLELPHSEYDVLGLMQKVCDWQLAHPVARIDSPAEMWERSVFYIGVMATYHTTHQPKYRDAALHWSQTNQFKIGPRRTHGDDHVIGQVYLELYNIYQDTIIIEDLKRTFDSLMQYSTLGRKVWNWSDGLFMAPPALVHLSNILQTDRYFQYMDMMWWDVHELLYDKEEHLFYRDNRYLDTARVTGKKIFWSRGNGWVLAGLARVINYMKTDEVKKEKYIQLFQEMAHAIAKLQNAEGMWRTDLQDSTLYPYSETSGTAFFTYAFAWGVNQGYLDANEFTPIIRESWRGLVKAVDRNGRLGWVQQPWDRPGPVYADGSQEYGTGAFLLAASEIFKMNNR